MLVIYVWVVELYKGIFSRMAISMISPELFQMAKEYATGFLSQGRTDWDVPHTISVVYYVGEIAQSVCENLTVLTLAAWFHDIGYFGLFSGNSDQYNEIKDRKALHMVRGAELAGAFLSQERVSAYVSQDQRRQVVHLVGIHDNIEELSSLPELVLMEADTLGAIDMSRVKVTFDRENGLKYLSELHRRRVPKFQTELGKQILAELLPTITAYFNGLS